MPTETWPATRQKLRNDSDEPDVIALTKLSLPEPPRLPTIAHRPAATLIPDPIRAKFRTDRALPTVIQLSTDTRLPVARAKDLTDSEEPSTAPSNDDSHPTRANQRTDIEEPKAT